MLIATLGFLMEIVRSLELEGMISMMAIIKFKDPQNPLKTKKHTSPFKSKAKSPLLRPCSSSVSYSYSDAHSCSYPNPESILKNSPKPTITAIKAIIIHVFGVQVLVLLLLLLLLAMTTERAS